MVLKTKNTLIWSIRICLAGGNRNQMTIIETAAKRKMSNQKKEPKTWSKKRDEGVEDLRNFQCEKEEKTYKPA